MASRRALSGRAGSALQNWPHEMVADAILRRHVALPRLTSLRPTFDRSNSLRPSLERLEPAWPRRRRWRPRSRTCCPRGQRFHADRRWKTFSVAPSLARQPVIWVWDAGSVEQGVPNASQLSHLKRPVSCSHVFTAAPRERNTTVDPAAPARTCSSRVLARAGSGTTIVATHCATCAVLPPKDTRREATTQRTTSKLRSSASWTLYTVNVKPTRPPSKRRADSPSWQIVVSRARPRRCRRWAIVIVISATHACGAISDCTESGKLDEPRRYPGHLAQGHAPMASAIFQLCSLASVTAIPTFMASCVEVASRHMACSRHGEDA